MGEERIVVGETNDVEGIDSDTGIVYEIEEGDGEIEIMTESTKIGEGREKAKDFSQPSPISSLFSIFLLLVKREKEEEERRGQQD